MCVCVCTCLFKLKLSFLSLHVRQLFRRSYQSADSTPLVPPRCLFCHIARFGPPLVVPCRSSRLVVLMLHQIQPADVPVAPRLPLAPPRLPLVSSHPASPLLAHLCPPRVPPLPCLPAARPTAVALSRSSTPPLDPHSVPFCFTIDQTHPQTPVVAVSIHCTCSAYLTTFLGSIESLPPVLTCR